MQQGNKVKKIFQVWSILMAVVFSALLFAACGDTATPVVTSAAASTSAAATTSAAAMTTTAAAGTTAMAGTTTAAMTTTAAAGTTAMAGTTTTAAMTTSAAMTTTAGTGATTVAGAGTGNGQVIRIYSSLPDTGSSKDQTDTLINAMKLAVEQVGGNVAGFKIDYVPLDDATASAGQWDPGQEASNANKAVNDPDAMVYIGTFNSGAAKVSIPILNKAGMAMVSPGNTLLGLTKGLAGVTDAGEPDKYYPNGTRNYFRTVALDDIQGSADANFMATTLKAKKIYIIDDGQAYGVGLAKFVEVSAPKAGMTIIAHDSITGKESDYKSEANKIKGAGPDAIFFGGISQQQAGKLLADIRGAGVKAPWVGGDGTNDDAFLKDAGSAGEGAFSSVTGVADADLPQKGKDFVTAFKAKYGDTIQAYTIKGYDSMGVVLDAIKRAGKKDRAAILQALAATKDYQGAQGTFSFDASGDATLTSFSIYKDTGGKWVYQSAIKPIGS